MKKFGELQREANAGDRNAQFELGKLYGNGNGVPVDQEESAKWYLKAASNGHPEACGRLGYRYAEGIGVKKDLSKAIHWTKRGADEGDAYSSYSLGNH